MLLCGLSLEYHLLVLSCWPLARAMLRYAMCLLCDNRWTNHRVNYPITVILLSLFAYEYQMKRWRVQINSKWPSHATDAIWFSYLNQCWLIITEVQWQSPDGNFTRDTSATSHRNQLENYWSKMTFKSSNELKLTHNQMFVSALWLLMQCLTHWFWDIIFNILKCIF